MPAAGRIVAGLCSENHRKTVACTIHVPGIKSPATVGIRGNDKPLHWNSDFAMKRSPTDNLNYRAFVTYQTGYLFTEVKFVPNDTFKLPDQPNWRVVFGTTDTTSYDAIFDKLNPAKTN